jgi:hypothetical protein
MAYTYDPMQSLPNNLQSAGLYDGALDPRFVSAIQTALARAGMADYGGQTAFDLLSGADQNRAFSDPFGYANELLAQSGVSGFSSPQEWQTANTNLPGHNESFSPFNPVDILSGVADVGGELLDEPGFQALLAAGGAGYLMGPGATAGSAGVGSTGGGYFGGLSPTATGASGLSTAAGGATGLTAPATGLGSLTPGFFASEGLGGLTPAISGAASAIGTSSLLGGVGDLLGGLKNYLPSGNTAAALAPIIAAIAYAKNQGPFDTSRLTSTYDQFEPDALAYEFDQNTNAGRNALTSSLTNRGVMGSSFGNMDLTNFQTTRDLGRRSLVNQGLAVRGGLANNILEAQVKERQLKNQLYGTSLLALGNVFGGRNNQGAP